LADINQETEALAKEYKATHYTDYLQMLDDERPEAVSIVVPTPFHYEVASAAIERGIHCLLEKPIASTVDEADKLIALAKKHKVVFTVGHIEHYNPLIKKLKTMVVDELKVGKISSVVCKRVGGFPTIEPKTDVIIDLAVHDIDIISYLLGKQPRKIYSHGSRTHHSQKIDSSEILLDYGDASGFVQANWLTPVKIRTIAVTGSEGYVEGNYITQELEYYKHNMQKIKDGFSNFVIKMGEPEKSIIKVDFEEPLAVELKAFLAKAQGNSSVQLVEPEAARDALHLALEAIRKSEDT
jgi:UDP-N-acetylglucosamine 3-dehydrogenase